MEQWETKRGNFKVIPQALWPTAKPLFKWDRWRTPIAIRGPLGLKYHPLEKANVNINYFENQFTPHDLCDETREWWVEARVQAVLATVDNKHLKK